MLDIPGIINPKSRKNFDEIIYTDEHGEFEVPITSPYPIGQNPKVEVLISSENLADVSRVILDKVGILAEYRDVGNGMTVAYWGNKARQPVGFLLRRGSYTLRAIIDDKEVKTWKIVSKTHPYRADWEDFMWFGEVAVTGDSDCILSGEYEEQESP